MNQRRVTMKQAATITQANLTSSNDLPFNDVTLTFDIILVNNFPSDGAFVITYPDSVSVEKGSELKHCTVSILSTTYRRSCILNTDSKTVTMRGGLPSDIFGGTKLTIVLGELLNPAKVV